MKIFLLKYESVNFKELHHEQEYYCPTIYRAGAAVVSTITSIIYEDGLPVDDLNKGFDPSSESPMEWFLVSCTFFLYS